jgi:uncharacterized membrane protein
MHESLCSPHCRQAVAASYTNRDPHMATWSANNLACTTTWTTLLALDQNTEVFADSGDIPMTGLTFFNNAASDSMRRQNAEALASMIDNIFRVLRGASYEAGKDRNSAVKDMVAILTDAAKTIADLAEANDANYRFRGENVIA